jgi:hypothetical protein
MQSGLTNLEAQSESGAEDVHCALMRRQHLRLHQLAARQSLRL